MLKSTTKYISKVRGLSERLTGDIRSGIYPVGAQLPSINTLSGELGVSRDTVFKAFMELKERGLIEVNPGKGYFVSAPVTRVLLLLDEYTPFKQTLYSAFMEGLPEHCKVDLLFHQYNARLFDLIIRESAGRYDHYVVMNFYPDRMAPVLKELDPEQLLLLDFGDFCGSAGSDNSEAEGLSYIRQDFREEFRKGLEAALPQLRRYRNLNFVIPASSHHPRAGEEVFRRFCEEYGFAGDVPPWVEMERVNPETAFLVLTLPDLVGIVKECRRKGLRLGEQVGLLAYNEISPYEVIGEGVSSLSVDFGEMGRLAARFVAQQERIATTLPTKLVLRASL